MSNGMKFVLCLGAVCLVYPPMIGYMAGMLMFFGAAYILYIAMGGNRNFF